MNVLLALLGLISIFGFSSYLIFQLTRLLPASNSSYVFSFPSNLEQLKDIERYLKHYIDENYLIVLLLFCSGYLYKQAFAIPGSVFMNLLAGALFGLWKSVLMTSLLSAFGASLCYTLSMIFGKSILMHFFPLKVYAFQEKLKNNQDGIFFFLLCLRLFPMSPNWFLNMVSPVIGIPLPYFFFSVLIGLLPYNFICCQTGCMLSQVNDMSEVFTLSVMVKLLALAAVFALTGFVTKHWKMEKTLK
ncbi:transmembrane protein 41A [Hydra vulgaris]|uniref:Transmembrane protein 41A n=1 Tax=Hydra vulgaris TaxID=6087 RepID=A0ABM4C0E8_HYDVU